jgi:hypothetical protein
MTLTGTPAARAALKKAAASASVAASATAIAAPAKTRASQAHGWWRKAPAGGPAAISVAKAGSSASA